MARGEIRQKSETRPLFWTRTADKFLPHALGISRQTVPEIEKKTLKNLFEALDDRRSDELQCVTRRK